jgi:periplasmic protein TonB
MSTLELNWAALHVPTSWYRLPSVKVAFIASVLLHAAAIVLLPNLRVPEPNVPPPLTVELVREPPPQPLPPPAQAQPQPPPPPVVKERPKPVTRPPVPEVKPEPKSEPPPVVETRAPQPPPQPLVVPQQPSQPEPPVTVPRAETPPQTRVEPPPAVPVSPPPRVQALALDPIILRDYGAIVSSAVAKRKVYPRLALTRRWQGTAELKLQVAADGNIKALIVAHSSGFEILDDQAMKMVKDSMPLPSLPDALRGREFALDIPVAFKLQD